MYIYIFNLIYMSYQFLATLILKEKCAQTFKVTSVFRSYEISFDMYQ